MNTIIYSRNLNDVEIQIASKYFKIIDDLEKICENDLIIARYSAEPFYEDLEQAIIDKKAILVNSYAQHQYLSNIKFWYQDLIGFTPETWFDWTDIPNNCGQIVVKGNTYSKKHQWNELMFAENKNKALEVSKKLSKESLMKNQELCFRKFLSLKKYKILNSGLPITKEFRVFVIYDQIIATGFYWSEHLEQIPNSQEAPNNFLQSIIRKIGNKANFYTIDVAQCEDNSWVVIELNEGQMSGLSCISIDNFYSSVKNILNNL
jgi:hypothetical protein